MLRLFLTLLAGLAGRSLACPVDVPLVVESYEIQTGDTLVSLLSTRGIGGDASGFALYGKGGWLELVWRFNGKDEAWASHLRPGEVVRLLVPGTPVATADTPV